ncbi:uncharacterized protein VP01_1435g7, partial [Puccinia sorghi]
MGPKGCCFTENPTMYKDEIQKSLHDQHGVSISLSTILNTLHGLEYVEKIYMHRQPNARPRQLSGLHCTNESGLCLEAVAQTRGWALV